MMPQNVTCSLFHLAERFIWEGNHGTAEVSDLGKNPFQQIYNDACDIGFGLIGRTKHVVFAVTEEFRNRDNDLEYWTLKSIQPKGFTLTLFND